MSDRSTLLDTDISGGLTLVYIVSKEAKEFRLKPISGLKT
jgi:hypothetical protein